MKFFPYGHTILHVLKGGREGEGKRERESIIMYQSHSHTHIKLISHVTKLEPSCKTLQTTLKNKSVLVDN